METTCLRLPFGFCRWNLSAANPRACLWLAVFAVFVALWVPNATGQAPDQRGFARTAKPAEGNASVGGYYALVIGINRYTGKLNALNTAVHDAESVAESLHSQYGFQVQLLLDRDATRANILNTLNDVYRSGLSQNDNFLIYYAGHGYYDSEADKAYWLPADAESNFSANHISADDLTTAIRAFASRHILIVSDSCYSGDLSRGDEAPSVSQGQQAFLVRMFNAPSRTLMSSGSDEPVSDNGPDGHSIFAAALLDALDNLPDPAFTAADLAAQVQKMVRTRSSQIPRYYQIGNSIRNASTVEVGDFVFIRPSPPAPAAATPPAADTGVAAAPAAARPEAAASDEEYARAMEFVKAGKMNEGIPLLTSLCDARLGKGCNRIGMLYAAGVIIATDAAVQEARFFRSACDYGDPSGCNNLGMSYGRGEGVSKSPVQAAELFRQACNGGEPRGCSNLGYAYSHGNGVRKDKTMEFVLYKKACDEGDSMGCNNLGMAYENGDSVGKDKVMAISLYQKACDGGQSDGCDNLKHLQH